MGKVNLLRSLAICNPCNSTEQRVLGPKQEALPRAELTGVLPS